MSRIVWRADAKRDVRAITRYYGEIASDLPDLLVARIEQATARLMDFLGLGATMPDSDVRVWSARATPYLLFYREVHGSVYILKVLDARTDWKPRV